jgi:hypothetical protein
MLLYACKRDCRNEPRFNEKGKLVPLKKGM